MITYEEQHQTLQGSELETMASLEQRSSSTQPTTKIEFGTRHSAFQPVRPRISKESTPWLPTGARRGGQPLMGPPPSPLLAPLTPPARSSSEERERSSESENESSLGSPSSSNHSPRLPQLSWGQQRDEYLALSIGLGAVEI